MTHRSKPGPNLALLLVLGVAGIALTAAPAAAQIAGALGKPLPSPDLPVGTISVRIVAGSAASPVVGTDVTLMVNDTPRVARTDSAGRATFAGLPAGAKVTARVTDTDKADHASDEFEIPSSGGVRVMITTKPWQAGAGGGAPFAGGAGGGMPNPRQLSGEPRPEQGDAPGTITVRVAYDDFKDTPDGVAVALVGYAADDTTSYQVAKTDKAGRVQFTGLDRSGGTSYFAMTLLPRDGAVDRVMSVPILLESQMGVRLVLSGEKRDSKAPPVDDLNKADPQAATPAGKVLVGLEGEASPTDHVVLIDAETRKPIGEAKPEATAPDLTRMRGGDQFEPDPKLPAGTLDIQIGGGPGQTTQPLKDITVRVIPADSQDATSGLGSVTGPAGGVRMALQASGPQKAIYTINGRAFVSKPFELGKSGGRLLIRANWEDAGRLQAQLDAGPATRVVYAECTHQGQRFRSLPFQLVEGTGSKISVYLYQRVGFRFELQAYIDDKQLAVQGKIEISNLSWAPYRAGPDGMLVPLPHGFMGGVVYDPDQNEVAVAANEGFRIIRPIPPGGRQFHGGFSLPVEAGDVAWSLDLPMGTRQSALAIKQTPGMRVNTASDTPAESRSTPQGTFSVIMPITIQANHAMVMSIEGLPSPPAWRTWVPAIVGLLVVGVILAGVFFALARAQPAALVTAAADARRQRLLDELVALERSGGNPKRREQLLDELEEIWT